MLVGIETKSRGLKILTSAVQIRLRLKSWAISLFDQLYNQQFPVMPEAIAKPHVPILFFQIYACQLLLKFVTLVKQ
ncbi:MAG: hypothetical protein F6J92_05260 [Symploca sp. SIO1A3]|nr:hypothetical protein [Symploca sp. SIO1A3]